MTKKRLGYQVIEDNAGGLHLAVFYGDVCIYYASGYEHSPDNLQEDIAALYSGRHPLQDGYDELTSCEYGWEIIADDAGVYPERMGAAGRMVFGLDD